ncbi:MAG: TonB-dependent receptor [Gammaproteobacteria bacterium]|nr:TonB-dependent receptor [Gammaproteobacteria bacterium]
MKALLSGRVAVAALASVTFAQSAVVHAQQQSRVIEEIVVTARQQQETLQDVPVTVSVLGQEDLERYNIQTLTDAADLIPNFQVFHGGSGNGSNIILRGIGSSSISAAFDQSVAINVDGVVVNIGRFIHNAYMDMAQIEVLKGPQSLYFGKSATAGVLSVSTANPGDEFEFSLMGGYEFEHNQTYTEAVISGPLSDNFGARLAVGYKAGDKLYKNEWPGVANRYRGDEAWNARLTLQWDPRDDFSANLKYAFSRYENDGANGNSEMICPEGTVQPTAVPAGGFALLILPGMEDCRINGNTFINDLLPGLRSGLPYGGDDGVPFLEQDTHFLSLQLDWEINPNFNLASVTGYVDLDHIELDIYGYNVGAFGGLHRNIYESISQEFRLASSFDGPFNFMLGAYYQDVEQVFEAYQYAFNVGLLPFIGGGPDPVTGNEYDYNKNHYLDTEVYSAFFAGYYDLTDRIELTAGVRYTREKKDGFIEIPYLHQAAINVFGFGAPALVEGLKFSDKNWSPEVAVNWRATDDVSFFVAYKEGFKSGGVDNSALPTNTLDPNQNPDFPDFLIYDSEEASGFEVGMKGRFLEGSMRLNATAFTYEYKDLQVQLFDSINVQFETFNASKLGTRGIEADLLWLTPIDGLSLRSSAAFTRTKYEDDFINAVGQNLKGQRGPLSAKFAGNLGITYDWDVGGGWRSNLSLDARYNDGYPLGASLNPFFQSSFWQADAALNLYSADERYSLALIARNLTDKIYKMGAGTRPGNCPMADPTNPLPNMRCQALPPNQQDHSTITSLGRQLTLQFRVRF